MRRYHAGVKRSPAQQLQLLRENRGMRERASSVGSLVEAVGADLRDLEKRIGGVASAWNASCPPALIGRTLVEGLVRGVLTIRADDASTRFELDRWLREGGQRTLVKQCPTTVRKVKIVIDGFVDPPARKPAISRKRPSSRG